MSGFPSWWLNVGDLVSHDDTSQIGVVLEVAEPGIIRVRWGTDDTSSWYNMTEFYRVKVIA